MCIGSILVSFDLFLQGVTLFRANVRGLWAPGRDSQSCYFVPFGGLDVLRVPACSLALPSLPEVQRVCARPPALCPSGSSGQEGPHYHLTAAMSLGGSGQVPAMGDRVFLGWRVTLCKSQGSEDKPHGNLENTLSLIHTKMQHSKWMAYHRSSN